MDQGTVGYSTPVTLIGRGFGRGDSGVTNSVSGVQCVESPSVWSWTCDWRIKGECLEVCSVP